MIAFDNIFSFFQYSMIFTSKSLSFYKIDTAREKLVPRSACHIRNIRGRSPKKIFRGASPGYFRVALRYTDNNAYRKKCPLVIARNNASSSDHPGRIRISRMVVITTVAACRGSLNIGVACSLRRIGRSVPVTWSTAQPPPPLLPPPPTTMTTTTMRR